METKDYKSEIVSTRVGCLGSSDAKMLAQIDSLGFVPRSAQKRLAVVKGLIPNEEHPTNAAMRAGDTIEMAIYEHLAAKDSRYLSNPLWVSEKYSEHNVKLISHPDLVLVDEEKKTIFVWEVKTTKFSVEDTKREYRAQLYVHYALAKERAEQFGKTWKVKLFLCHYSTEGIDLEEGITFEPDRLTISEVRFKISPFDVARAMRIADAFLSTFDYYSEEEEIDANLLPDVVRTEFDKVAVALREIKEREELVEDFKRKLYDFLVAKNIKKISCDAFCISRVDSSVTKTFDAKSYLAELTEQHPTVAKRLKERFTKSVERKGYALIKLNNK